MPKLIREESVSDYTVQMWQRQPGEEYATEYAVWTADGGRKTYLFSGCFGYGDCPDYMHRKFDNIKQDLMDLTREAA